MILNQTLRGFIKKELIQTLRDPRMRILLFLTPIIQMTLFGVALSNEVKNIRLAALFDSKDYVLRDIYERSINGKWFVPARSGETDPFKMIQAGDADAVLVPPPGGFTRGLGRSDAPLQLLIDSTNVTQAQAVENYLMAIVRQTVMDDLHLQAPAPPIQFDLRVLYNPSLDTSIFMVPGVMCMLMVMTTMMLCMTAITREKEMGTFEMLISAPVTPAEVIYGKTIPYVILGMCNLPLTLAVAVFVFGVPMRGSFLLLTVSAFFFVCTCVAIGTLISTICRNQQQANLASFLFMFPAIMFSGLLFPIENMPQSVKFIAYIDPLFHYLALLRNIMLKGGDLQFVVTHVSFLAITALVATIFSFRRFHTTLQ
ncbi:MAG: ABC transporter permease [Oligoflexia bacterium]|nr:ABC transporter permease [Oligoflexia bacterium]